MSEKYEPSQEEIEKAEEMAVEGEMTPEQEKMSEVRADGFEVGYAKGAKGAEEKGKYEKISNIENLIRKWRENYSEVIEDGARKAAPKAIEKYELEIELVLKEISGRDNINDREFIDNLSYVLKHNLQTLFKNKYQMGKVDGDAKRLLCSFAGTISRGGHEKDMYELYNKILEEGQGIMNSEMRIIIDKFEEVKEIEGAFSRGGNRYILRDDLDALKWYLSRER